MMLIFNILRTKIDKHTPVKFNVTYLISRGNQGK